MRTQVPKSKMERGIEEWIDNITKQISGVGPMMGLVCAFTRRGAGSDGKESAFNAGDQVQSLGWEDPWRREWLPTPVFMPGESHGQGNQPGCSPWDHKESSTTELARIHTHCVSSRACVCE